ncbi:TetR family transcriptional regulator [Conexibacter sp. W3-3-2]|uniref:TetR/AcrR family transcriptional regulator n=1 Tax=Conexibacter sp. W3-3-2 TaxID=2675227 RepID=UPI0012B6C645|nr:TetR/AcrR family transcriptional regulator [Conexibacter sp. W3-3-2]MTD47762.1 TetR family transcriptional regulator [Conexibacter sp. W3-3-2]
MVNPPRTPAQKLARRVAKTSQRAVGIPAPRRTQAERRATTRTALLDAALASLGEDGYASITTRRIAERAGVSQGTQQHYFATKAEFVVEAMRYAVQQIATDAMQRIDVRAIHDPEQHERLLDELWRVHQSLAFRAALELWIAARTDAELLRNMRGLEQEVGALISDAVGALLPDDQQLAITLQLLEVALSAIRGYAMLAPVVSQVVLDKRWAVARGHIAALLRAHLDATT